MGEVRLNPSGGRSVILVFLKVSLRFSLSADRYQRSLHHVVWNERLKLYCIIQHLLRTHSQATSMVQDIENTCANGAWLKELTE